MLTILAILLSFYTAQKHDLSKVQIWVNGKETYLNASSTPSNLRFYVPKGNNIITFIENSDTCILKLHIEAPEVLAIPCF